MLLLIATFAITQTVFSLSELDTGKNMVENPDAPNCGCHGIFPGASCDSGDCTGGTVPNCSCGTFSSDCGCSGIIKIPNITADMIQSQHIELLTALERHIISNDNSNDDHLIVAIKGFKTALTNKNIPEVLSKGSYLEKLFSALPKNTQDNLLTVLQNTPNK